MWSFDFIFSVILFSAAMIVAYTIVSNVIGQQRYTDIVQQAQDVAESLAGEGYPKHWTRNDVIRAGLYANGRLSLRKARELARLSKGQLRTSLRVTDNVYIYATNNTGVVSIFGTCGVGDTTVSSTSRNETLNSIAIAGQTTLSGTLNTTVYQNDTTGYREAHKQDVIVIEGPVSTQQMTASQITNRLRDVAKQGITFVLVGNISIPILGLQPGETNTTRISLSGSNGVELGFLSNETINTTTGTVPTMTPGPGAGSFLVVATNDDGSPAFATWIYEDSTVWFFNTVEGTRQDGTSLKEFMTNVTRAMITVDRPSCQPANIQADHIAHEERVLAYHDTPLTVRVLVWGDE